MDKFVTHAFSNALTVGHFPTATLPLVQLMNSMPGQTTLCDHFFHAAFGGSFLNHFWLIAAATPVFPGAPSSVRVVFDEEGRVLDERAVTPHDHHPQAHREALESPTARIARRRAGRHGRARLQLRRVPG